MKLLAALLLLVLLAALALRRRPEIAARHPFDRPFAEDWDDPAMDVYDAVQPPDPRLMAYLDYAQEAHDRTARRRLAETYG